MQIGGYPSAMQAFPQPQGPDGAKRAHLYIGNLSPRVTEYMLQEIFSVAGPVLGVKIIPDRNYQHGGLNYGFVEYHEMRAAETALQTLNGRKIFDTEIRVNWALQNSAQKEDLTHHFHVFCGDLSPEVNDAILNKAFSAFPSLSDARVMWDMNSGKSRGYGFLAFRDRTDAEQAIATMNGEWLGSRAIRVNWANQKNAQAGHGVGTGGPPPPTSVTGANTAPLANPRNMGQGAPPPPQPPQQQQQQQSHDHYGNHHQQQPPPQPRPPPVPVYNAVPIESYETVVNQTPHTNATVYVGNLVPYTTQADLIPLFQGFGYITEIRMQADRGFAFVKLNSHENAAMAIVNLQATPVHGRPLKVSWGKDKFDGQPPQALPQAPPQAAPAPPQMPSGMPMPPMPPPGFNPAFMPPPPPFPGYQQSPYGYRADQNAGHQGYGGQQGYGY